MCTHIQSRPSIMRRLTHRGRAGLVRFPVKLPPPLPSPGALAQREALRAAAEFFSNRGSDDDGSGSESEGE